MAKETNKPEAKHFTIRDAGPEDAAFLAKCVMAGMHYYDFGPLDPGHEGIFRSLTECERRTDLLYTFANSRIAEIDGKVAGSLLSYPGDNYKELRHKTFSELWPEYISMDTDSEQETGPGEYYLDTLAVGEVKRRKAACAVSGRRITTLPEEGEPRHSSAPTSM